LFSFAGLQEPANAVTTATNQTYSPLWRRGKRAGLITPRSPDRNGSAVFYIRRFTRTYHAVNTATTHTIHRHGAEAARGADNPEVTGSKPVAGILHSQVYKNLPRCQYSNARHCYATLNYATTHYCRCSSVAERLNTRLLPFNSSGSIWGWLSAHNGEVTGSKPVAGIIPFRSCFQNLAFSLQQLTLSLPVWRRGSAL
jgi:hypothetical protein